jgi:WD40 repeat protein
MSTSNFSPSSSEADLQSDREDLLDGVSVQSIEIGTLSKTTRDEINDYCCLQSFLDHSSYDVTRTCLDMKGNWPLPLRYVDYIKTQDLREEQFLKNELPVLLEALALIRGINF